jgi:hypothetical protein
LNEELNIEMLIRKGGHFFWLDDVTLRWFNGLIRYAGLIVFTSQQCLLKGTLRSLIGDRLDKAG